MSTANQYSTFQAPNMMWWFLVFFFCFLVHTEKSSAQEQNDSLIADDYVEFVNKLPVPTIEYGDQASGEFENMYTEAVRIWSVNLASDLLVEAQHAGQRLIDELGRDMDRFRNGLSLVTPSSKTNSLDEALKRINNQLNIFLRQKPEDLEYHRSDLPPLPKQEVKLKSRTKERSVDAMFLNFVKTADSLAHQMFAYITSLFLRGWDHVRPDYETVRIVIYKEILNGPVMRAYRKAVDEIDEHSDLVQRNVSPKTWKSFRSAADHIIAISHDK